MNYFIRFWLVVFLTVGASVRYGMAQQPDMTNTFSAGFISSSTAQVTNITWRPDFQLAGFGFGLDVDIPLGDQRPLGYENIVARYISYQGQRYGARYGLLENVTVGQGLLMKNYSTRISGPLLQSNRQNGISGYWDSGTWRAEALSTGTGIYSLRGEQSFNFFRGGVYYITDTDGVSITSGVVTTTLPPISGYGVDVVVPTTIPALDVYAEYAQLVNFGAGLTTGARWGYDFIIAKLIGRVEYQQLAADFAPGIFNSEYEVNPLNFAAYRAAGQARKGTIGELDLMFLNYATLHGVYEGYDGQRPSARADLKVADVFFPGYEISGYFIAPNMRDFRGLSLEQGAVLGGRVGYKVNPFVKVYVNYKRAFNGTLGRPEDTTYYEFVFGG